MYFQYRLYSIIVTFINKIFLIRLWLIHGISHQHLYFEATDLQSLLFSCHQPDFQEGVCHGEPMESPWSTVHAWGSRGWSLLWGSAVHRQHSESLPAAARSIQSKHFLPFFLSFLIHKTRTAIQLPFGKHFEVYGQSTLVLYIGADVFQPLYPPEIITLHSLGSREDKSMVFCSSLLMFVKPPLPWHSWSAAVYFLSLKVMGSSHCCRDTGGKVEPHTGLPQVSYRRQLSQPSVLVTLCLCTVPRLSSPVQGHHW